MDGVGYDDVYDDVYNLYIIVYFFHFSSCFLYTLPSTIISASVNISSSISIHYQYRGLKVAISLF